MNAQELLQEISDYCRQFQLTKSTFSNSTVTAANSPAGCATAGGSATETLDLHSHLHDHSRRKRKGLAL